MIVNFNVKNFIYIVSFALVVDLCTRYFVKRKKIRAKKREINEVIVFGQEKLTQVKSKYAKTLVTENMSRLLYYLSLTQRSLDICLYVFTNLELLNMIQRLHYKGVKIRCIMDSSMAFSSDTIVKKLEKLGIPMRFNRPKEMQNLMHHKFCLIDASEKDSLPLLMVGSLNWTNQAIYRNWENVIVTSQTDLIKQFKCEFERLWNEFKPQFVSN